MAKTIRADKPLTREQLRAAIDEDGRIKAVIPCPAGALLNGLDWLNDYADDCILPEDYVGSLGDISYKVVGFDPDQYNENFVEGLLYLEVHAEVDFDVVEEGGDDGEAEGEDDDG